MQYLLQEISTEDLGAAILAFVHAESAHIGAVNTYLQGGSAPAQASIDKFNDLRDMSVEYASRTVA